MTEETEKTASPAAKLPITLNPWLVLLGGLVLYVVTLNPWVTFGSLPFASQIMGWNWHPGPLAWRPDHQYHPLFLVLTYPLRFLSAGARIQALNLFTAACAAATLAILARSIRLVAHNRTKEQRLRERAPSSLLSIRAAFLPAAFAVLLLAGQLTFWENAVTATGEMLDLLVFAFSILCLLEFRVSQHDKWLGTLAFVYGLGAANNWAMVGFFPFFFLAVIWLKRMEFLRGKFLLRMIVCGILGLLLYGLTPLLGALRHDGEFWDLLHKNLVEQHIFLLSIPRYYAFTAAVPGLFPLLFACINWPTFRGNGDLSAMAMNSSKAFFRILHLAFLAIGILMFFEVKISLSPRNMGIGTTFGTPAFLTFYYLAALSIGYFTGYVLLVFGKEAEAQWRKSIGVMRLINPVVVGLAWVVALGLPVLLFCKNFPVIHDFNAPVASEFGTEMAKCLPDGPAVVLSDDPALLYLTMGATERLGTSAKYTFVQGRDLLQGAYVSYLVDHYPAMHKEILDPEKFPKEFAVQQVSQLLVEFSKRQPVYYLHPSFGSYFERVYMSPHGIGGFVHPYPTNALDMPVLRSDALITNQAYWITLEKGPLAALPDLAKNNPDARHLTDWYSQIVNNWGVELQKAATAYTNQRAALLNAASGQFAEALRLNPRNVLAGANQQFNAHLRNVPYTGATFNPAAFASDVLNHWDVALILYGPADAPDLDIQMGRYFADHGAFIQAIRLFDRALDLSPNDPVAQLDLAKAYIEIGQTDAAFALVKAVRQHSTGNPMELARVEALAYAAKGDYTQADKLLTEARNTNAKDGMLAGAASEIYRLIGLKLQRDAKGDPIKQKNADAEAAVWFKKSLAALDQEVQLLSAATATGTQLDALSLRKAEIQMSMKDYDDAVKTLTALVDQAPVKSVSLLNRAISEVQLNRLDAAKNDYQNLEKITPTPSQIIYYALVQIAQKQNDKSSAIHYAKLFLKYASPEEPEFASVTKELHKLETE